MVAALYSANRDPIRFPDPDPDPDLLDVARTANSHLAFGHGAHHCVGAALARMEGRIALRALFSRFPNLELAVPAAELRWRPSLLFDGLVELPVRLGPQRRS